MVIRNKDSWEELRRVFDKKIKEKEESGASINMCISTTPYMQAALYFSKGGYKGESPAIVIFFEEDELDNTYDKEFGHQWEIFLHKDRTWEIQ
jgi:hypothetical protein